MMQLRDYQRDALDALYDYWRGGGGNPLIVLPTGSGKSLVIAAMVKELLEAWPDLRIGVITHTKELIVQNYMELLRLWPGAPAGIYSSGVGRYDARSRILFCGVQSVFRRIRQIGRIDVLIVDESHTIPRSSDTMYGKFIEALREEVPDLRIVGLTATPYRLDSGRLDEGADAIFDKVVYEAKVTDLIAAGYLSPLISKASLNEIDVSTVHTRGGEFIPGELERASRSSDVVRRAVAEMVERGAGRRSWLAFCCGVAHATDVRDALRSHGISAETINGQMPSGQRDGIIRRFREGQIHCLTSVAVLSIGFNVPQVDLVALMRPTLSTGLYIQQVGRAFRRAPGKENALILDFSGNTRRHGPVDAVVPNGGGGGAGSKDAEEKTTIDSVRAKVCPDCESMMPLHVIACTVCGHEWPREIKPKHQSAADDTPILTTERVEPEMIPVVQWKAQRWQKEGAPDSLRITYYAGLQTYSEWVLPERAGHLRYKFELWWSRHGGGTPPVDVTEALARFGDLAMPATIAVRRNGKFFDITSRTFAARQEKAA